jgi:hypothetical protein
VTADTPQTLAAVQVRRDPTTGTLAAEGLRRLAHHYLNDVNLYVNVIRLEPGPSSRFRAVITLEMDDPREPGQVTAGTPQNLAAVQARQGPTTGKSVAEDLKRLARCYLNNSGSLVGAVRLEPAPFDRFQIVVVLEMDDLREPGQVTAGTPQTLAAVQACQDLTTGISAAEDLRYLAHRYLNNPGSLVGAVRLEPGPFDRFQIVVVLEMDDLREPGQVTAGTPQTLAAVQARQNPTTGISAAEDRKRLAHRYLDNPCLLVSLELGPSGGFLVRIGFEVDDLLESGDNHAPYDTLGHLKK